ncbi:MAG: TraM recognition domain-containing protein [Reichenbachiella sp.]|uniref:type IV secretory system conjugative DNA transfer family protein n=1 Tax=Reichenbachiella sp. TaxID=2184521 RepID=UPI00326770B1
MLCKIPGTDTPITWADAVEGILSLGATGSGKSSGPGKHMAMAMLKAGFGFCVLCAKPDERSRWEEYANAAGRVDDLVIFNKESGLQFNFLKYELKRPGQGAGDIFNANNALMNLNEQNRQYQSGGGGNNEERYWDNSLRRLISLGISALILADEEVSIYNLRKLISGSFVEEEAKLYFYLIHTANTQDNIDPQKREEAIAELEEMMDSSYFTQVIYKIQSTDFETDEEQEEVDRILDYWLKDFARLSERTRSIVVESFMGIIDPFMNSRILKKQFASGLSPELMPEKIFSEKKIVIIDFPLKEFGLAGLFASVIYKSVFQGAMERRKVEDEDNPKPACIWIDEVQNFLGLNDTQFQATARSSWTSAIYLTQNLPGLFPILGNNQPQARAKSLLGNLNLKFFGSNSDYDTNQWASEMIGKHLVDLDNLSINKNIEFSKTKHQHLMPRIMPDHFTTLKTGRKTNKYKVETVVFKAGKTWGNEKKNFAIVEFDQRK